MFKELATNKRGFYIQIMICPSVYPTPEIYNALQDGNYQNTTFKTNKQTNNKAQRMS